LPSPPPAIMTAPMTMLPRRHSSTPQFNPEVPWEYFRELEMFFGSAQIVNNMEKKKHACWYIDIDTADLWESIPEFNVAQTFEEFKLAIHELYPGFESERKWTIADMNKLVGEQLQMGILNVNDLGNYYWMFYSITKFLLNKNQISEAEQSRAFGRGFQVDLWHWIMHWLEIKLPDHDPDNSYPLSEINEAAKHVLHGALHTYFLQPNVIAISPPALSSTTSIKTEQLSDFFEQFTQTLAKAMGSQGNKSKPSGYTYNSNAQAQNVAQALLCIFCRTTGYFIGACLVCQSYIADGKCKKNAEGKVVLLSGQYCPGSMLGWFIKERIDEWHK
jgi:hypothetical protein